MLPHVAGMDDSAGIGSRDDARGAGVCRDAFGYDAAGNRTSLGATLDGVADFQNDYTFDPLGRMTQITQADGSPGAGYAITDKRVDLAYDDSGRFAGVSR